MILMTYIVDKFNDWYNRVTYKGVLNNEYNIDHPECKVYPH